ncbi:MAG: Ig-like domain repeat protein, partial [Gemmatimonadota bacterium]
MRRRAVLAVAVVCVACGDTAGPYRMRDVQLSIAPVVADDPVPVVDIASVRIQLTHPGETTPFIDTLVTVSPNQVEFSIEITVPISDDQETCVLSIMLYDPAGVEVYRSEPTTVTIGTTSDVAPVTVPIEYVGPGADAVIVEILEHDAFVYTGDAIQLTAVARDAAGEAIDDANIGWMALDPLVTIEDRKAGIVRAGPVAGEARVVALLPRVRDGAPSIEDTTTVPVHANEPPEEVQITSPEDGAQFLAGETVSFAGSAHDPEDGPLSGSALSWESGLDGAIGNGASFTRDDLSAGTHQITLTATDSRNATSSASIAITVAAPLTITTTALPDGAVGTPYDAQLEASGGADTYVWSLSEGVLPVGLQLMTDGSVSGIPTSAGTAAFTVRVVSGELSATRALTITIGVAATTTTITSDDPDPSQVGEAVAVSYSVASSGGTPTGDVAVSDGVDSCNGTVADGGCTLVLTTAGDRTLTAVYSGNADFAGSSDTEPHTVNQPPIADAGPDQTVTDSDLSGSELVTLDGSGSTDADGTIVSYDWSEGGSSIAAGVNPTVDLTVGVHTITLTVTDNGGATGTDAVTVEVIQGNSPPVADAGQDQTVNDADGTGAESVTLDGSGSSDDGTIVSYDWSEGVEPIATGESPTVSLGVGVHTIALTVTDDDGATDSDQVVITVVANQAPTANAGQDQTVSDADLSGSELVTLDGSGSADADGTIVSYDWSEGGTSISAGVNPTVNLTVGVHTITLTVTDNGGATGTDAVTVEVIQGN